MESKSGRITDNQGHAWPVTGYWCDVCGMPIHSILRSSGVHPGCEALGVERQGHIAQPRISRAK